MNFWISCWLTFFFLGFIGSGASNQIFLLPAHFRGDYNPFVALGEKLLDKGHEVYVVLPDENRHWVDETKYHFISSGPRLMTEADASRFFLEDYKMDIVALFEMMGQLEDQIRKNALPQIVKAIEEGKKISNRGSPVLVSMMYPHIADIAEYLGIPHILFISQGPSIPFDFSWSMNPLPAGYYSFFGSASDSLDTFSDRLTNTVLFYGAYYSLPLLGCNDRNKVRLELNLTGMTHFDCFMQRPRPASMVLYPTVVGLTPPAYFSPTVHFLGTIFLDNQSPFTLPQPRDEVLEWVETSDVPVIYASFSTVIDLPKAALENIYEAMKNLPQYRFLWSLRQNSRDFLPTEGIPSHIRIENWVNQIQVLKSPKVTMIISTGGANTIQESLYYAALPILCIPVMFEQNKNCFDVSRFGAGARISKYDVTSSEIIESNIKILLGELQPRQKAEDLSVLLKAGGGAERGALLIESVALIGNNDHAVPRSHWMSDFKAANLDMILGILTVLLLCLWLTVGICVRVNRGVKAWFKLKVKGSKSKNQK